MSLTASAINNQKYAEKVGSWGVLKITSSGYFHEDHLEGITNLEFQLSITSSWEDISNFKMHKMRTVNFVMNSKKFFWCQDFELLS